MSNKRKKHKNRRKQVKKIIISICVCVLIQLVIGFYLSILLPNEKALTSNDLLQVTIIVEDTEYIPRTRMLSPSFYVYSAGVRYCFNDKRLGEDSQYELSKKITAGDQITMLCLQDDSLSDSDFYVVGAYSDSETYRSVDNFNKDQQSLRPFVLVVFAFVELSFLSLVVGYFYLSFGPSFRKGRKQQKKNKGAS